MGWPGPVSHRQFEAWLAWQVMQGERLKRRPVDEPAQEEMSLEDATRASKARWRGRKLRAQQG